MNNEIQFILYRLPDEEGKVQVVIKDETIWATQKAMAQLFGVGVPAISKHLNHIFGEGELSRETTVSKLEKVRSIRASERRIWQQITDIYADCSFDYDRTSPTTREFYQMVQNRFHYAIQDRPPQRLSTLVQATRKTTWDYRHGRMLLMDVYF